MTLFICLNYISAGKKLDCSLLHTNATRGQSLQVEHLFELSELCNILQQVLNRVMSQLCGIYLVLLIKLGQQSEDVQTACRNVWLFLALDHYSNN